LKKVPTFLIGVLAFVIVHLLITFIWDGEILNWKKDILQSVVVGSITMAGLIKFSRKKTE